MRLPLELYNFRMSLGPASAAAWNRSANSGREHVESLQLVHSHVTLYHLVSQVSALEGQGTMVLAAGSHQGPYE